MSTTKLESHFQRAWLKLRHWNAMRRFHREFDEFRRLCKFEVTGLSVNEADLYPCIFDRTSTTYFEPHYTYHTAWAARILAKTRPAQHIDIASSLYFVGIASAFVPMEFYDFRPANLRLPNLRTFPGSILALPFQDDSVSSVSCLHVMEHIGLGRYGDPLDPKGDQKAAAELQRVLAPGGDLLMVLPIGKPRVCFNAHRIYSFEHVCQLFFGLTLVEWACLGDDSTAGLYESPDPHMVDSQSFGCGCFRFTKSVCGTAI